MRLTKCTVLAACLLSWILALSPAVAQERVLRVPSTTDGPKGLDPVRGSTVYDNLCCSQVYQTILQYKYLKRPLQLEPLLAAKMPEVLDNGLVWKIELKQGIMFHDDACFPGGKGRELRAADVIYSWKRLADPAYKYKNFWLIDGMIEGFNEYRDAQKDRVDDGEAFDYDAEVSGLRATGDYTLEIRLTKPVQQFIWRLSMFQMCIVPREAVDFYKERFNQHPVGTGPFILKKESDWVPGTRIVFHKNPNYWEDRYPTEWEDGDEAFGFGEYAGRQVPFLDRLEFSFFVEALPQWEEFKAASQDYTTVPDFGFDEAFTKRSKKLKQDWVDRGIVNFKVPLLDFIFRTFNMDDELVGGYTEDKKALRQAIQMCIDWDEMNEAYYWGTCQIYDGPIPPGLDGYPENGTAEKNYRGPDYDRARDLLRKAGYTIGSDGKVADLPVIEFYTSAGSVSEKMTALLERNLGEVGIRLNPRFVNFTQLMEVVDNKKAPMFSFAWHSDYPDAENNLSLFYGPFESPGSNHSNYKNPEYDRLYEKIKTMPIGPERTAIYVQMRDMLIEDTPFCGSLARTRYYVVHPWVKNFKPTEDFRNFYKYLDVDMEDPRYPSATTVASVSESDEADSASAESGGRMLWVVLVAGALVVGVGLLFLLRR